MNKTFIHGFTLKINYFFFVCGLLMAGSEVWKQLYLTLRINHGVYEWWYFPFQLCSIAMYVLLALPWVKRERVRLGLLSFLMSYSLLGGIAVFADTSGLQYPVLVLTAHSYLWHILLIIIGFTAGIGYVLESKAQTFRFRAFWGSTLLYLFCCITAVAINLIFDSYGSINMFYINPNYEMQQVVFSSIARFLGNTPAILLYILATITGSAIFFSLWSLAGNLYNRAKGA